MAEVRVAYTSADESEAQEARTQTDGLPDLHKQIQQLICTRLSDHSFMVRQEQLRLMQRSSFYLELRRHDKHPSTSQVSDTRLWNLMDQKRLQSAMTLANERVEVLLTLQELLYEELMDGCRELEAFIAKDDQGSADGDMAAHAQQRFLQTLQNLSDFDSRTTLDAVPLYLENKLIPNNGHTPRIPLSASLIIKLPVMINRLASCVKSNVGHLHWEIEDTLFKDLKQEFHVRVKSLNHPSAEEEEVTESTCRSYNVKVTNLKPNRYYEFSVRRVDTITLVREGWTDTIVLGVLGKDVPVSK